MATLVTSEAHRRFLADVESINDAKPRRQAAGPWNRIAITGGPPVDRVIYLAEPHEALTTGQATMAKGVRTVHDEIEPWLEQHGIKTEYQ